ncbi:hypothetical protein M3Y99_00144500 [Aphelenchoides fujianensis]|nr:hypothetical protein M3Y99_00144500 [Aphelenchoides fujianensis]
MSHVFFSHGVLPTVHACATTLIDRIKEDLKVTNEGNELDVLKNLNEYSADVIFRMAYGRTDSRAALQQWASATLRVVETSRGWFHNIAWALPWMWRLLKGMKFVTTLLFQFPFIRFIRQLLLELQKRQKAKKEAAERGEEPQEPADFIDFFMQSESTEFRPEVEKRGEFDRRHAPIVKELTLMEVFGQCVLFAFAGFDTVANTLSFVLQFMTVHPKVQERMRAEIHEVFGDQESLDYDQLNELKFAEAVIKETLRLFPLGEVVTSRRCMKPTELAGIPVEAGVDVLIDVMSIHRDPELWGEDANEFRPERWLDDARPIPANGFFGFGAGLRECVGRRLAYLELKVVLVELLRNFRLVECPRTKDGVDNVVGFLMRPSSLFVRLEELKSN